MFNKALVLAPESSKVLTNRGISKYVLKDFKGAMSDFNLSIKNDKSNEMSYWYRAQIKTMQGDIPSAIEDYNTCIKLNPNDAMTYNNRGNLLAQIGEYHRAIRDFDSSIKLDDSNFMPYETRASCKIINGDINGGCQDLRIAKKKGAKIPKDLFDEYCN